MENPIDNPEVEGRFAQMVEEAADQVQSHPVEKAISNQLPHSDRRRFLKGTGLTALGAALGMAIPFGRNFPEGLVPAAFAQDTGADLMSDKERPDCTQ